MASDNPELEDDDQEAVRRPYSSPSASAAPLPRARRADKGG